MRLLLPLLALWLTACVSSTIGVRPEFQDRQVETILVTPFYATTNFGSTPEDLSDVVRVYQEATMTWLRSRGFKVMGPDQLRAHLEAKGAWREFVDGVLLERELQRTFEPTRLGMSSELRTIQALTRRGALPSGVLMFGEVLYQTQAVCRERADRHTVIATVVVDAGVDLQAPHPCVTSHMQAKLVEPASGLTMWYNRLLRERHMAQVTSGALARNVARLVEEMLGGEQGLRRMRQQAQIEIRPSG